MRVYQSMDARFRRVYAECANSIMRQIECTPVDFWPTLIPSPMRILLVELLGKGGVVREMRKVRTITKGPPSVRIHSGVIGQEGMKLAERHGGWETPARGGRPNIALVVSLVQLVDMMTNLLDNESLCILGIDNNNYYNCQGLLLMLNCLRRLKMHPICLIYLYLINRSKSIFLRNGKSFASCVDHCGGVQGTTEVMIAGTTAQVPGAIQEKLFLQCCFDPATGKLDADRIRRAATALRADRAADKDNQATKWRPYTVAGDVDEHYHKSAPAVSPAPLCRDATFRPSVRFLEEIYAESTKESKQGANLLANVILCVDDKIIAYKTNDEDHKNGNVVAITEALNPHEVHILRKVMQYLAASKFESLSGNGKWKPTKMIDHLAAWREKMVKGLHPFGVQPKTKTSTQLLGMLINFSRSVTDTLWDQATGRMGSSRRQAELVLRMMHAMDGHWMKLVVIWAYLSPIVHLLPVMVRVWDQEEWRFFHFDVAWSVLGFMGFRDIHINHLLERNALKRCDLFALVFSEDLLDLHDPRMLGTKVLRNTCSNAFAVLGDDGVLPYITTTPPLGRSDIGFNSEDREFFKNLRAADKHFEALTRPSVRRTASKQLGSTSPTSIEAIIEEAGEDAPVVVPLPASSDFGRYQLGQSFPDTLTVRPYKKMTTAEKNETSVGRRACVHVRPSTTSTGEDGATVFQSGKAVCEFQVSPGDYESFPDEYKRQCLRYVRCVSAAISFIRQNSGTGKPFQHARTIAVTELNIQGIRDTGTVTHLWQHLALWQQYQGEPPVFGRAGRRQAVLIEDAADDFPWWGEDEQNESEDVPVCSVRGFCEVAARDKVLKWPKRKGHKVFFNPMNVTERLTREKWKEAIHAAYLQDRDGGERKEEGEMPTVDALECLPMTQMV